MMSKRENSTIRATLNSLSRQPGKISPPSIYLRERCTFELSRECERTEPIFSYSPSRLVLVKLNRTDSESLRMESRGEILIRPVEPVLARLEPALATRILLTREQFDQLIAFVRDGLLDPRAAPDHLRRLVPRAVPSGRPVMLFEFP